MKFLVDMPLSPDLAAWLRAQGHDAVHAAEIHLGRAADSEIIQLAIGQDRTIITADLDYPRLFAIAELHGPSLILFRDGNWSDADIISRLESVLQLLSEKDIVESIIVIDRGRVRRRRLPIR